ncbi:glycosyltransferase family 2 protein [Pseudoprimorskyibacter insulae]|uniref:Glycosyl transferase family 2 n=1 Tax=Pseudoprimorskyibacter insulae TaxID=1695997 RepID=A0A2R8AWS0_9RHOB|nr:glycosyltransferase family 2 protein [Pseudoprimorskyibacter insulae]SPF80495.1 hypothetical protein PRI8871_02305 [Pseudoprimorskyibacter insulae]
MKIILHIGPDAEASSRLQAVMDAKRGAMLQRGVLFARSPNARNHTRLFMAVPDPDNVDVLRFNRGFLAPDKQAALAEEVMTKLTDEVAQASPDTLILSAHHFGAFLARRSEIARLRSMLAPLSTDISVVAHVEDPARMLLRRYALQLMDGRARSLAMELSSLGAASWWDECLTKRPMANPRHSVFPDVQGPCHWLDFARLVTEWDAVFGAGATQLRALDMAQMHSADVTREIEQAFGISGQIGKADFEDLPQAASAASLTRFRQFNEVLFRLIAKDGISVPRLQWGRMLNEIAVDGPAPEAGSLHKVSARFAPMLADLRKAHPALTDAALTPDAPLPDWREADPLFGYRPTQYVAAYRYRINKAANEAPALDAADAPVPTGQNLSPMAEKLFTPLARQKFESISKSVFAPHNRIGTTDEETDQPPYSPAAPRDLRNDSTGRVIVGCMKNEAPYILEWIAYHRCIGIDSFMIFTNGCEDTTDPLLKRLEQMGIVHHRDNEGWTGKSPQQYALNKAIKDPVIRKSDWIIHIDVDEYINVRCGNGTLDDFLDRVPDATNIAMTWRLFGHGGVTAMQDKLVIDQFDRCAPKYCPKPHTVWGFKTMTRNIGAYGKLSCHRPNQLKDDKADQVRWVNGSGQDMTKEALKNGWRNSKRSIGYDLLQLNHYALRSADSFLVKRQRGRALHVNRSIGLNYWIRMDWNEARDVTIRRNIPRVRAELDRLLADDTLRRLHDEGVAWHQAKAQELHQSPEFEELYQQAVALRLTDTERASYALALDVES